MAKNIRVIETDKVPSNKQAKELLEFAKATHGHKVFPQKDFLTLLKAQHGKNTALKDSKADPSLTWNYYRPGLWNYGFIDMFEEEVLLKPKMGSIDPFKRTRKVVPPKTETLEEELARLQGVVATSMDRIEAIETEIAEKAQNTPQEPTATENDGGASDEPAEMTDEEMAAATEPDEAVPL